MQDCSSSCPTFHGRNFTIDTREVEDLDGLFEVIGRLLLHTSVNYQSSDQSHGFQKRVDVWGRGLGMLIAVVGVACIDNINATPTTH